MADRKLRIPNKVISRPQRAQIKATHAKLPSIIQLSRQTLAIMNQNKRFFIFLTLWYILLSFIFIQGSNGNINISQLKAAIGGSTVETSLGVYSQLLGSSTQTSNQTAAVYQFILVLIFSLTLIFGLRHMYEKKDSAISLKRSFYEGMTPLVPMLLVLLVLALQLLPLSIGASIYAAVSSMGLAVSGIEQLGWLIFIMATGFLSLYLVSGSMFGLFIITLPEMTPMRALRASRKLVRFRRLVILRKIVFLPLLFILFLALVTLPFITFAPIVAELIFFLASCLVLPISVTYLYNLYRSML